MKASLLVGVLAISCLLNGCGPKQAPLDPAPPIGSTDRLRRDLGVVAESGIGESSLQLIEESVNQLEENFPKKAELQKAVQRLNRAPSGEPTKKIATEMLQLVNAGAPSP